MKYGKIAACCTETQAVDRIKPGFIGGAMKILKGVGIVVVILIVVGTQKCFYSGGISENDNVIVDDVSKVFLPQPTSSLKET